MLEPYTKSPCKRDALPTELTARTAEIADFPDNLNTEFLANYGTGRERGDNGGPESPEIVPKTEEWVPEGYTAEEWAGMRRISEILTFDGGEARLRKQGIHHLRDGKSYVYFIGGDSGAVKIGVSIAPAERAVNMSLCSPIPLRILARIEGRRSEEKAYHQRFAAYRLHGEWFERTPAIEAEIARLNDSPKPCLYPDSGEMK